MLNLEITITPALGKMVELEQSILDFQPHLNNIIYLFFNEIKQYTPLVFVNLNV